MKKRAVGIKRITLGAILLITGLCFVACTDQGAQKKTDIESMEPAGFTLDMSEDESATCTYSDQEKTVVLCQDLAQVKMRNLSSS